MIWLGIAIALSFLPIGAKITGCSGMAVYWWSWVAVCAFLFFLACAYSPRGPVHTFYY